MVLNITGTCFTDATTVSIDDIPCTVLNVTYSMISCMIPPNVKINLYESFMNRKFKKIKLCVCFFCNLKPTMSDKNVRVVVSDGQSSVTVSSEFFYDYTNTAIVNEISPLKLNVLGNSNV